ncbi:MAG: hypothetical protein COA44_01510 [Arcobacter sp.]|nr:MAG: hypothetical protein COA44_01510 [Arcobacter sp.]
MNLDAKMIEKIEALSQLLGKSPKTILDGALDLYFKVEKEKQLEDGLAAHKKETDLTYDEFWDDVDVE